MSGLLATPAYREHIVVGLKLWQQGHELTRRNMLLLRCSALDRQGFPARPAPGMVAVADAARDWLSGLDRHGVQGDTTEAVTVRVSRLAVQGAFSPAQIQTWNALQSSAQGQRGLAVVAVANGLDLMAVSLTDVNSGRTWNWPLAKVRRLADELKLRSPLDQALDDVIPGGRNAFASASEVPGVTQGDDQVLDRLSASTEALNQAFFSRLSPEDLAAYRHLQANEVYARWPRIASSLMEFALIKAPIPMMPPRRGTITPQDFCTKMEFRNCGADSPLYPALLDYRAKLAELMETDQLMQGARRLVKQMPEAGCP